jgi:hypothetical protein
MPMEHRDAPATDNVELKEIEAYARSADASSSLRLIQSRIDAGRYAWKDVAAGRVDDPALRALLDEHRDRRRFRQLARWAEAQKPWPVIEHEARRLFFD